MVGRTALPTLLLLPRLPELLRARLLRLELGLALLQAGRPAAGHAAGARRARWLRNRSAFALKAKENV
jgi:hypothetical protein